MYKVTHSREARVSRKHISAWYSNINPKLATKFELDFVSTIRFIKNFPKAAPFVKQNIRQTPIRKTFPYNLIYLTFAKTIIILAIRHHKQLPIL